MSHRSNAIIAKKGPYVVELEKGKTYFWCTCGHSEKQPFCDGSHKVTDFEPLEFVAEESKKYGLCGCKHTKNAPICDRQHSKLD
ncbi:CDGSH iron-sulfur domain-containing protein [Leucothrix sargassi]|nr:CDGSH iron-sulfur domain-containing protein [Leucothrix sargassi]